LDETTIVLEFGEDLLRYIERPAILDIRGAVIIDNLLIAGIDFALMIVGYPIYEICSLNS
jgi:hypothetical protein